MTDMSTAPVDYPAGSGKYNTATKALAVRTVYPDDEHFGGQTWLIATTNLGAKFVSTADVSVAPWVDINLPAPATP